MQDEHKLWHSRGYLPHFDSGAVYQSITYRLADSIPQSQLKKLRNEVNKVKITDSQYRAKVEQWLDNGMGSCVLRESKAARVVIDTWKKWDGERYDLLNWVVMPNHVHVLIRQHEGWPLNKILHSWKSFTANMISSLMAGSGKVWAPEYWDRYIRDEEHFANVMEYIDANPVKAGLVEKSEEWGYGAARERICQE